MPLENVNPSVTPNGPGAKMSHAGVFRKTPSDRTQRAARFAAILFITATATTMAGQMIIDAQSLGSSDLTGPQRNLVALAVLLEIANGLASAGIALALYPVLRRASELAATGYLGLRIVEGALGVVAAAFLLTILNAGAGEMDQAIGMHDATFLTVLIVFSCGTLLFYPMLYQHRLVPRVLSVWGLIGGVMLLISCLLILFGRIEMGSGVDTVLSLPIWVNEMALAAWLLLRGLNLSQISSGTPNAL